jgi:hypothetical protein
LKKSQFTGDINYFPIINETFWWVVADGLYANSEPVKGTSGMQVVVRMVKVLFPERMLTWIMQVDTGTTLVCFTHSLTKELAKMLGGHLDKYGDLYVDCSSTIPTIALRLNGSDYEFSMEDLVIDVIPVNTTELSKQTGVREGRIACILPFTDFASDDLQGSPPKAIVSLRIACTYRV